MFVLNNHERDEYVLRFAAGSLLTCGSFEERVLVTPDWLASLGALPAGVEILSPLDVGSRWEAECSALQRKNVDQLTQIASGRTTEYEFDLINDPILEIVDDAINHVASQGSCVLIDISTMPKAVLLPTIAFLLTDKRFTEVAAIYTAAGGYTSHALESEPTQPEAVAPFDPIGASRKVETAWIPILGFSAAAATSVYESFSESYDLGNRIFPILGFPAVDLAFQERSFVDGTRGILEALRTTIYREHFKYAAASDPFDTFTVVERLVSNLEGVHCIGSPFGPKPMTLGMAMAALQYNMTILVAQARSYNPSYSVGHGHTFVYPLKQSGALTYL